MRFDFKGGTGMTLYGYKIENGTAVIVKEQAENSLKIICQAWGLLLPLKRQDSKFRTVWRKK